MQQLVQEITGMLDCAKSAVEADSTILHHLGQLGAFLGEKKSQILDNPDTDGVYFYYAAEVTELVIKEMGDAFRNYQTPDRRSSIVKDSLILMPAMKSIFKILETDEISKESIKSVLSESGKLIDAIRTTDYVGVLQRTVKSIDRKQVGGDFSRLMDYLEAMPDHEYRIKNDQPQDCSRH